MDTIPSWTLTTLNQTPFMQRLLPSSFLLRRHAMWTASCLLILTAQSPLEAAVVEWIGLSGNWNDPANWSGNTLPSEDDDAVIDVPGDEITVTHGTGAHTVKSIRTEEPFILSGGSLTVSSTMQVNSRMTFSGGTFKDGTLAASNPGSLIFGDGALDGVTVNGDMGVGTQAANGSLRVTNGLALSGTLFVGSPTNAAWPGSVVFAGVQTLSGQGSVVFGKSRYNLLQLQDPATTLTLGSGITVQGQRGQVIHYGSGGLVNRGTISADVAGGEISLATGTMVNQGTLQAAKGGTLHVYGVWTNAATIAVSDSTVTLNGTWHNAGSIKATNSTVNLGGNFVLADLGDFNRTGGTVNLTGTLDNRGKTVVLDATTGSWRMDGGTVLGGTLMTSSEVPLILGQGTLDRVTVNGDIGVGTQAANGSLRVTNGLALNGTLFLGSPTNAAWTGGVIFAGIQTLSGQGSVVFGKSPYNLLQLQDPATTLTLGSGITVRGQNGQLGPYGYGVITNQGNIAALGGSLLLNVGTLVNDGSLQINSKGIISSLTPLTFGGAGRLAMQDGAKLQLRSSLTGSTRENRLYSPGGKTVFEGIGTADAPLLLEVMSQDTGLVKSGFINNFVYGQIELVSTYLRLVDEADNATGADSEALYVNSLVVPSNSTLDLNGLHIYTLASYVAGTIVGGSITQLPDAGPIALSTATAGSISVVGQVDEWSFFGRAGESVTVSVDSGSTDVLEPQLRYAEVSLIGPAGNLVARDTNQFAGGAVVFQNVILPLEGTYLVRVRAPSDQAYGNYRLVVWNNTSSTTSLVLNQQVTGQIETPFSADVWVFSAVAGQQVRLDLINTWPPVGVEFTLVGPNGWIGFTNLIGDSGFVTMPDSGEYRLTAQGYAGAYEVAYTFTLRETVPIDLAEGTVFTGQFVGDGQAQLFRVAVSNTAPLRISLTNGGEGNRTELYVGRGAPPTRTTFDFRATDGPGANREILVPGASSGELYVLVYGDYIQTPGEFTLQIESSAIFLTGVKPDREANNSPLVLTLNGAGFVQGTSVELLKAGTAPASATNVSIDSFFQVTAMFAPGLPAGVYSVRTMQPDGHVAILANAFEMLSPGKPHFETRLIMPASIARLGRATLYMEYANTGTAAMPAPLLVLKSVPGQSDAILTLHQSVLRQALWSSAGIPGTVGELFLCASGRQPGILNPGERISIPVYFAGLEWPLTTAEPGKIGMEIRYWMADDSTPIDWSARKESLRPSTLDAATWDAVYDHLTAPLTNTGAYVRMLDDNARYLGGLGQHVVEAAVLWNFEVSQAAGELPAISTLDEAVDSAVTSAGLKLELVRRYSSNLRARNSTGLFGRGWYTPWQNKLQVEDFGDVVTLISEAGSARVFTRDIRDNGYLSDTDEGGVLTQVDANQYELQNPNGIVTRFRPDGKIDHIRDANHNRITTEYDSNGQLVRLAHASGPFILLSYNRDGHVQAVTDSAGRSVSYAYDASGAYLQTVTTDDGKVTRYTYESGGTSAQRHALTSVTRRGTTRYYTFGTDGRLASTYLGSGEELLTFGYDENGGVSISNGLGTTRLYYDHRGLLSRIVDPVGNVTTAEFGDDLRLRRLVAPSGESRTFAWCDCGSPSSVVDEVGSGVTFRYDGPYGRLTSLTDARGNTTAQTYDVNGNLLSRTYPNGSVETFGDYTALGLVQRYTNRRSQSILFSYTSAGQVDRKTFGDGSYVDFEYDERGNIVGVTEHAASGESRLTEYAYDYDRDGDRLRKITYPDGRWVEYLYDTFGRNARIRNSAGGDTSYEYDVAARLWKVGDAKGSLLAEHLYNAAGKVSRINRGNGTFTTYDYDAAGRLLRLVNLLGDGSIISSFEYTYDNRGLRRTLRTQEGDWTYDYDSLGQLTHAVFVSSNPLIPNQDLRYSYDEAGNRVRSVVNGDVVVYAVNKLNQYTQAGSRSYRYDLDGNLVREEGPDGATLYGYDDKNRLIAVERDGDSWKYTYDALGNRIATEENGVRTHYLVDPTGIGNVVAEYNDMGNLVWRYIHGFGLTSRETASGERSYYTFDAMGNVSELTDAAGSLQNAYTYRPFGETLPWKQSEPNPFLFAGQFGVMLEANGLQYVRARHYDPMSGRFLQTDPLGIRGATSPYSYAQNNPVDQFDVNGLESWKWGEDTGNVVVGGLDAVYGVPGTGTIAGVGALGPGLYTVTCQMTAMNAMMKEMGLRKIYGVPSGKCAPPAPPGGTAAPGGAGSAGTSGASGLVNSLDPNQKLGPSGSGLGHYVPPGITHAYRIDFENDAEASAPAQRVRITDQLDANFVWETFRVTEVGFGDVRIPVPANSQYFATNVLMTCCGDPFEVHVEVGIRLHSGQVYANFYSIDPVASLPPPVNVGFLPPENGTGRGQGHVSYLIDSHSDLATGAEVRNVALIWFDYQESIATNQRDPHDPSAGTDPELEALITIDADPPFSAVNPLPTTVGTVDFAVSWAGIDAGAGVANYDIFASTNGGLFGLWLPGTTNTSAIFTGRNGDSYAFYSIARDLVGHVEAPPLAPDAETRVDVGVLSVKVSISLVATGQAVLIALSYPTLPGKTYTVERRESLSEEDSWQPVAGGPHNSGLLTITNFAQQQFYRVRVE